ncbi:MAG: response regulator transcription factor [Bacteroidia bacterium]|nr:response regulator transcription factor [Bacteroidia bacterium]
MKKILLAEDEINLLETIKLNLELENYLVTAVDTGRIALHELKNNTFDAAVLDVMLPEIDGFSVCENIRSLNIQTPVLFLTAKSDAESRIKGLKIGGSDYLSKPFELEELLLRVKILLQKGNIFAESRAKEVAMINGWVMDFNNYQAEKNNLLETLSKKETELLHLLYINKNKVVSRDEILENIWKNETIPTPRTIDNFILQLRKLFENDFKNPQIFLSIRGVGYKMVE